MKKILFVVALLLFMAGCEKVTKEEIAEYMQETSEELIGTKDEGILRIGTEVDYPPFNWMEIKDENGAVIINRQSIYANGYDIMIAKELSKELGLKLEIEKIEWNGLEPSLKTGSIDLIIAGMSPTPDRKLTMDFSDEYYKSNLVVVIKKGSKFENAKNKEDFKGAKLTAQQATLHYDVIDSIDGAIKEPAMDNFPAMRAALRSEYIDGYISELPEAKSATMADDSFIYIEPENGFGVDDEKLSVAIGLRKGSELREKINSALKTISLEKREELMNQAISIQPVADI